MRRLAALTLTVLAAGLATVAFGSSAQGSSTARFDVIFDDARGLIGGQLVKIAGAQAGTIQNVVVTPEFKARIEATVDSRFLPFHQDATCTIRPQGLIAENYIDCDPGSANSPPLKASGGHPPTVPVTNTTEPVSLLDLFNMFNLPTRQRFMVMIDELGIGTAARGQDFNEILRRANPALALARQALGILARQQAQLATLVDATSTIAAHGAGHTTNIKNFLDRSAALSATTAAHSNNLALAINRLPGLLAAARPALQQLDTVAVDGTPLVQQIHAAVPSLNRVARDLGPFVAVAKPGLAKLRVALEKAIPTLRDTTPLVQTLGSYASKSKEGTLLFAKLSKNLQQSGFVENFLSITYYIGASLARFDANSHLLSILLVGPKNGACGNYATTPVPGCSAHYGSGTPYQPAPAITRVATPSQRLATRPAETRTQPPASPAAALSRIVQASGRSPAPALAQQLQAILHRKAPQQTAQSLQNLVDYLLR